MRFLSPLAAIYDCERAGGLRATRITCAPPPSIEYPKTEPLEFKLRLILRRAIYHNARPDFNKNLPLIVIELISRPCRGAGLKVAHQTITCSELIKRPRADYNAWTLRHGEEG